LEGAYEREIDGITRQSVAGNCEPRYKFALEYLQAHANGTREDNIRRNAISEAQSQSHWQPLVRKIEDHKSDQPDTDDAQSQDQQALQEAYK
jgi:hypothetical protein